MRSAGLSNGVWGGPPRGERDDPPERPLAQVAVASPLPAHSTMIEAVTDRVHPARNVFAMPRPAPRNRPRWWLERRRERRSICSCHDLRAFNAAERCGRQSQWLSCSPTSVVVRAAARCSTTIGGVRTGASACGARSATACRPPVMSGAAMSDGWFSGVGLESPDPQNRLSSDLGGSTSRWRSANATASSFE